MTYWHIFIMAVFLQITMHLNIYIFAEKINSHHKI
jgi:hypothetical protein